MDDTELKEWQQSFIDIEESIEQIDVVEGKDNPYAQYLKMKQQELF